MMLCNGNDAIQTMHTCLLHSFKCTIQCYYKLISINRSMNNQRQSRKALATVALVLAVSTAHTDICTVSAQFEFDEADARPMLAYRRYEQPSSFDYEEFDLSDPEDAARYMRHHRMPVESMDENEPSESAVMDIDLLDLLKAIDAEQDARDRRAQYIPASHTDDAVDDEADIDDAIYTAPSSTPALALASAPAPVAAVALARAPVLAAASLKPIPVSKSDAASADSVSFSLPFMHKKQANGRPVVVKTTATASKGYTGPGSGLWLHAKGLASKLNPLNLFRRHPRSTSAAGGAAAGGLLGYGIGKHAGQSSQCLPGEVVNPQSGICTVPASPSFIPSTGVSEPIVVQPPAGQQLSKAQLAALGAVGVGGAGAAAAMPNFDPTLSNGSNDWGQQTPAQPNNQRPGNAATVNTPSLLASMLALVLIAAFAVQ